MVYELVLPTLDLDFSVQLHRLVPIRSRQDALASFVRQSRVQLAELTEQLQVSRGSARWSD